MFVIYYAPRHYDILIKLLKASTMSSYCYFTTQTYDLSLPCLAHTADSSAVLRSNSMSKQHFSGLTNRRG